MPLPFLIDGQSFIIVKCLFFINENQGIFRLSTSNNQLIKVADNVIRKGMRNNMRTATPTPKRAH
uniref:Uncharacterized protein n=1 Tax=Meloidogyne enterolobii TaxID=390850 RepID=A0A6V7UV21_MELEN|nr:unnamed protein product [Meloidogyne enterolobii]